MWTTPSVRILNARLPWHHRAPRPCRCTNNTQPNHNDLVQQLLQAPTLDYNTLTAFIQEHKIDTQFLIHLRSVEEAATDPEQQQTLWWLGSRLTVLLEGLDTASYEDVVKAIEAGEGGSEQGGDERTGDAGVAVENTAIALRQQSLQQLSPEGLAFLEQQVAALRESMVERKMTSTTALLGRTEQDGSVVQAVAAADAAGRILDYLLSLEDAGARAALLPDAFSAEGEGEGDDDEEEEENEQLSTTPLLLLQAIERRLRVGADGEGAAVLGEGEGVRNALEELRRDVLEYVMMEGGDGGGEGDTGEKL